MAIQSDDTALSKGDLKAYHERILPYLGGNFMMQTAVSDYYSTDEKVIGIWKDKPLYKKTFSSTLHTSSATIKDINVSSIPIEEIVEIYGVIKSSDTPTYRPISCVYDSGSYTKGTDIWLNVGSALRMRTNVDMGRPITITIKYTKTTDTTGSTITTPGAYDLNRPDLWPTNKEIFFGNGLYGYRANGKLTASANARTVTQIITITSGLSTPLVNCGGCWVRDNAGVPIAFGQSDSASYYSCINYNPANGHIAMITTSSIARTDASYNVWFTYIK